jgi:hypothetical protein
MLLIPAAMAVAQTPEPAAEALNLLANGGFEGGKTARNEPEAWSFFTSKMGTGTIATNAASEGTQCLRIRAQGTPGGVSGVTQELPVGQGQKFTFTAKFQHMEEDKLKGNAFGLLVVEWRDFTGKELQRSTSKPWKRSLGQPEWDEAEIRKAKPPQGAVQATFGVHLNDGPSGSKGSMLVDDVVVTSQ